MVEESRNEDGGVFSMNTSTSLARVLVRQMIEAGITDAVISPGSRNAPLIIGFTGADWAISVGVVASPLSETGPATPATDAPSSLATATSAICGAVLPPLLPFPFPPAELLLLEDCAAGAGLLFIGPDIIDV